MIEETTMRSALFATGAIVLITSPAFAADEHCITRILKDVSALEASEQVKSKANKVFGPVDRIKVHRKTGKMYFCEKGSYCYDSNAFELNSPCRIKRDTEMAEPNYFVFFTR